MVVVLHAIVGLLFQAVPISGLASHSKSDISVLIKSSTLEFSKHQQSSHSDLVEGRHTPQGWGVGGMACSESRRKQVTQALAGSGWMGKSHVLDNLRAKYKAVHVVDDVPTEQQVLKWGPKIVIMMEGPSLLVGGITHYYNMLTIVLPHMLRYVVEPLTRYGHADRTTVFLHKQRAPDDNCRLKAMLRTQAEAESDLTTRTAALLISRCKSLIELLPTMLPEIHIEFSDGLPYCEHTDLCYEGESVAPFSKDATLVVLPNCQGLGYGPCGAGMLSDMRKHFIKPSPVERYQVTLIARGQDLEDANALYAYERNRKFIPNMKELATAVGNWSSQRNLGFEMVELERMTFAEQLTLMHRTRVLIGSEGAGLANMIFLPDIKTCRVVELNWEGGKTEDWQEFPTIARQLGMGLHMHIYGKERDRVDPVKLTEVLTNVVDRGIVGNIGPVDGP